MVCRGDLLVVEDEFTEADEICRVLRREFPERRIRRIDTEAEFYVDFEKIFREIPALVIMDVMLRWENPKPKKVPRPRDVAREGILRAGIRCQQKLYKSPHTREIPVILYTQLNNEDLQDYLRGSPSHVHYLAKSQGSTALVKLVKQLLGP